MTSLLICTTLLKSLQIDESKVPIVMALPLQAYAPKRSDVSPMPTDDKLHKLKSGNYLRLKSGVLYGILRDVPALSIVRSMSSAIIKVANEARTSLRPGASAILMPAGSFTEEERKALLQLVSDANGLKLTEDTLKDQPMAFAVAFQIRYRGAFGQASFGPTVQDSSYKIPVEPRKPGPPNLDMFSVLTDGRSLAQFEADRRQAQEDPLLGDLPYSQFRLGTFRPSLMKLDKESSMLELGATLEMAIAEERAISTKAVREMMLALKSRLGGPFELSDRTSADEQFDQTNRVALKKTLELQGYSPQEIETLVRGAVFQSVGVNIALLTRMKWTSLEKPQGPFAYAIYP